MPLSALCIRDGALGQRPDIDDGCLVREHAATDATAHPWCPARHQRPVPYVEACCYVAPWLTHRLRPRNCRRVGHRRRPVARDSHKLLQDRTAVDVANHRATV